MSMDDWLSKRREYMQRGLPQRWPAKDGQPARDCHCRECEEARAMGLGNERSATSRAGGMLFADPDWKPRGREQ